MTPAIDWDALSPTQRNDIVGEHLGVAPEDSLWLYKGEVPLLRFTPFRVLEDANACLNRLRRDEAAWSGALPSNVPWAARREISVRNRPYHINYSGTPGGAWVVVEALMQEGWAVTVSSWGDGDNGRLVGFQADRNDGLAEDDFLLIDAEAPMPEVVCVAFLILNGIDVTWSKLAIGEPVPKEAIT